MTEVQTEKAGLASGRSLFKSAQMRDFFCLLLVLSVVAALFAKTVFLGTPISHVFLLSNRDILFREFLSGVTSSYDESVYLMVVPYFHLAANYFRWGELPLWNSFSGWGQPFAGDIILSVFSPLRLIFSLNPCLRLYNLILVLEIVVAAWGTFLLARSLRVSRPSSVFAALSFCMCPFIVWFAELPSGTSACFLPLLVWTFSRLANHLSVVRALLAGVASGIFILSGHPEVSFIGITAGSILLLGRSMKRRRSAGGWTWPRLRRSFLLLVVAGITAYCTCSTVLLEFINYALHGNSYKFTAAPSVMPWPALVLNLLQPCYGGISPFAGSLALPLLITAALATKRNLHEYRILVALLLGTFFVACRPGFTADWLRNTPINWIPGTYCTSVMMMLLSVLAAIGLDQLIKRAEKRVVITVFAFSSLAVLVLVLALHFGHFDFHAADFEDAMKEHSQFRWQAWFINLAVFAAAIAGSFFVKLKPRAWMLLAAICLMGNFISQAVVVKYSLPPTPRFEFKPSDPIPFLKEKNERIATIGYDILSANDNVVFAIPSIAVHSPLVLDRYEKFMRFLTHKSPNSKRPRTFNTLLTSPVLSRYFDMTGIKLIVSLQPVSGEEDAEPVVEEIAFAPQTLMGKNYQLKLKKVQLSYAAAKGEIKGELECDMPADQIDTVCTVVINDKQGNALWYGGQQPIKRLPGGSSTGTCTIAGIVPLSLADGGQFEVALQILDSKAGSFLADAKGTSVIRLKTFEKKVDAEELKSLHYQPIYESRPHHIRVYRNNRSVSRAYIVHRVILSDTPDACLNKLAERGFAPHREVVVESKANSKFAALENTGPPNSASSKDSVQITLDKPNEVRLSAENREPGVLVLTDTNYPGWTATVDGSPVDIYQANYMFRGILLPKGSHTVVFKYAPLSLKLGIATLVSFLGVLTVAFFWSRKSRKG